MLHLVVIQSDAFPLRIDVEVLGLAFLRRTSSWPPTGLFDFQPSIHVLGKETLLALGKMPHFVDFQHHVAFLHSFLQFRGAPGALQRPLFISVRTLPGLIMQGSVELVLDTGPTQWEGQFIPCAIGQDRMIQAWGRQHSTFGQTKVWVEVHGVGGCR